MQYDFLCPGLCVERDHISVCKPGIHAVLVRSSDDPVYSRPTRSKGIWPASGVGPPEPAVDSTEHHGAGSRGGRDRCKVVDRLIGLRDQRLITTGCPANQAAVITRRDEIFGIANKSKLCNGAVCRRDESRPGHGLG